MSNQNGKHTSSNSFQLLKKARQRAVNGGGLTSNRQSNGRSKTPQKLNDIRPSNVLDKQFPNSAIAAQKPKELISALARPQSTKSTNYSIQSSHREQFDRYFINHQPQFNGRLGDKNRSQSRDASKQARGSKDYQQLNNYNVPSTFRSTSNRMRNHSPTQPRSEIINPQSFTNNKSLYQSVKPAEYGSKSFTKNYTSERLLYGRPFTANTQDIAKRISSSRSKSKTPDRLISDDRKASLEYKPKRTRDDIGRGESSKITRIGNLSSKSKNFSSCQVLSKKEIPQPSGRINLKQEIQSITRNDKKDINDYSVVSSETPISYGQNTSEFSPSITPSRFDDSSQTTAIKIYPEVPSNSIKEIQKAQTGSKITSKTQYSAIMQQTAIKPKKEPTKQLNSLVTKVKKGQMLPFAVQSKGLNGQAKQSIKPLEKSTNLIRQDQQSPGRQNEKNLFYPIYQGTKYYQTALIHFHYAQIYQSTSPYHHQFKVEYKTEECLNYFKELYEEHFIQTFYSLRYCMTIPQRPLSDVHHKISYLPPQRQSDPKRTVVFDLDETLIHCNDSNDDPCDFMVEIDFPENETIQACINIRPYCKQVLEKLAQQFELIVFTASHKSYAEAVLQRIDPQGQFFKYRYFRESCVQAGEGLYIKDLRVIGNRNLQDIVLIDNASYSFCHQLDNGIPIIPFYDRKEDKELLYLANYLLELNKKPDWIISNRTHFSLDTYKSATSIEDCLKILIDQEN